MKSLYVVLALCLWVWGGCTNHVAEYTIEGTLPSMQFDGEWIYLVPMENAPGRVDSVRISNAAFRFTGTGEEMKILRVRYALRARLQELLVVTEPGVIQVHADTIGSVTGTPQNDAMQDWKVARERYLKSYQHLYQQYRQAIPADTAKLVALRDSMQQAEQWRNFSFLKAQGRNTVGTFFRKTIQGSLTQDQREQLDEK